MTSRLTGSATIANLNYDYDLSPAADAHLVFMVHGKAGNKQVMQIFRSKFSDEFNFIYPEAPVADQEFGGFSWWLENTTQNFELAAQAFFDFTVQVQKQHQLSPRKTSGIGFSQGGALLSSAIQTRPLVLNHLALISSYFPEIKAPEVWPELFIFHGTEDQDIPFAKALELSEYLAKSAVPYSLVVDQVGHKISSRGMKMLKSWAQIILK